VKLHAARPVPDKLSFSIAGEPKGKQRAIAGKSFGSGKIVMRTPPETIAREKEILHLFKSRFPNHRPWSGPILFRITAIFGIPAYFTAQQRALAMEGKVYATKKPDKDNIEKLVLDALNGIAWVDDAQLSGGTIKRYGEPARIAVTFERLHNPFELRGDKQRRGGQRRQKPLF
jgi:Holliday junction resolvase RusA-like endonuclease